ncbi:addiction module protein [Methylomonas sp. HYX-M1]|uniref:addiction module protein n=1 Tax=Methylomonas sp. HYX-M1 TaxID=3139307 RepID=UPI00345B582F
MNSQQLLNEALQLKASEKFSIIDALLNSLDKPDSEVNEAWSVEAEKRLTAYREGRLKGVPMEEIFSDQS